MPRTLTRKRRTRKPAAARSPARTYPTTPRQPTFGLIGRDASGAIVASDRTELRAKADAIAGVWRDAGLTVDVLENEPEKAGPPASYQRPRCD